MFKRKNIGRTIGMISLIVLICTGVLGIIGACTNGFTDFEARLPNEDNMICVDDYVDTLEDKREDGLTIEVNEDGVIAIKGENETKADVEIAICEVALEAGEEYTLTSNANGASKKTYYVAARSGEGESAVTIISDDTFEVEESATYTIYIVVCEGEKINTTFKPVLNEGDEAIPFYVFSQN